MKRLEAALTLSSFMFGFELNIQNSFPFFVEIECDGLLTVFICDGQSDSLKCKCTYISVSV